MRKVVLQMQLTIDGFVGGPNGEIDWIFKSMDDGATAWIVEHVWRAGVHIMGGRTYRDMAAHWPSSTEPFAAPMNEIPKVVFSRSRSPSAARGRPTTRALEDASRYEQSRGTASGAVAASVAEGWAKPRVASRDLTEEIMRLKREPGKEILAHGGRRVRAESRRGRPRRRVSIARSSGGPGKRLAAVLRAGAATGSRPRQRNAFQLRHDRAGLPVGVIALNSEVSMHGPKHALIIGGGIAGTVAATRTWSAAVDHKLAIIRDAYAALYDDAATARAELLEVTIVLLIVFEVILAFVI